MLQQRPHYPPNHFRPNEVSTVGAHSFRIHSLIRYNEKSIMDGERVWITSLKGDARELLPTPPLITEENLCFDRFAVSPDQRIILADRKVVSGVNQVFVFRRARGLHYRLASPVSLNDQVDQRYGRFKKRWQDQVFAEGADFILFQMWLPNGRDALLTCNYGGRSSPIWYAVTLNTHTGALRDYHKVPRERVLIWPWGRTEHYPGTRLHTLTPSEVEGLDYQQVREAIREMYRRRDYGVSDSGVSQRQAEARMWPVELENLRRLRRHQARLESR